MFWSIQGSLDSYFVVIAVVAVVIVVVVIVVVNVENDGIFDMRSTV